MALKECELPVSLRNADSVAVDWRDIGSRPISQRNRPSESGELRCGRPVHEAIRVRPRFAGYDAMHMIRRGRIRWVGKKRRDWPNPIDPQVFGIAA